MERECCRVLRQNRDYAEIVRNLTTVLQERNAEMTRLQTKLRKTDDQLYKARNDYKDLQHRCNRLEYEIFCRECKRHYDVPREPGDCFEYLACETCKALIHLDEIKTVVV